MRPILFNLGSLTVPSFFFTIMVGTLAATFFAAYMAKREKADQIAILDFGILGIIASVLGSRLFHIIVEKPHYYLEEPIRVFYFWQGGFVSLGAFIGSAIAWFVYMHKRKLPKLRYLDIAVTGVPIIIFFVRVGCLLAGCCYGKPTDFFIHIVFTDRAGVAGSAYPDIWLHATQPYFMINAVVMWGVILLSYNYKKFHGQVLATFMIYYGITRFMIEFLRGDDDRGLWFSDMLSTGQVVMIITFIAGIILWFLFKDRMRIKNGGRES